MYDVMNWGSYDNVTDIWLKELTDKAPSGIPIVIVGNKMENRDTRKVSVEVVAESISNKFEPEGIGYCEISVKTNQNLAEPFLFLTKRILNINDSKALYFVSKISELNLIESMLQHKKNKDDKQQKQIINEQQSSSPKNLDNLFGKQPVITNDINNSNNDKKKGGDYLDDILFQIDDNNNSQNNADKKQNESDNKTQSISMPNDDDNFLADMMASNPSKLNQQKSSLPKAKSLSFSPKNQSIDNQQKRNRANSAKSTNNASNNNNNNKNKKTAIISKPAPKQQHQQKKKVKHAVHVKNTVHNTMNAALNMNDNNNNNNNNGVVIDILLGIQETLNNLQSDVRKLQNDVNYLKQQRK